MVISLDYDNTYTRDPEMWNNFIALAKLSGHIVYCVTMRYPYEEDEEFKKMRNHVDDVFFTSRMAKSPYMFKQGISVDVWIDDNPIWINTDAKF